MTILGTVRTTIVSFEFRIVTIDNRLYVSAASIVLKKSKTLIMDRL